MIIGLSLSFKQFSLDGKFHIAMVNKYLHYKPIKFARKESYTNWNEKKHKKEIEDLGPGDHFLFISSGTNSFMVTNVNAVKKPYQHFLIEQDQAVFNPTNNEIEQIITRIGFSCAYVYDAEYKRQQSEKVETRNWVSGILPSLFEWLRLKKESFTKKIADISGYPGRDHMISSTELMACWKMWFGEEFYSLVPKERLLSFKGAFKIEQLANDIIFVQLFENVEDSPTKKAQQVQREWRKWLNFDDLIKRNP
jgi:signal recognition particle subunit SEC65